MKTPVRISATEWLPLVAIVLVCVAFFPTITYDYVPQDQWRAFRYSIPDESAKSRAIACARTIPSFYLLTGRPLVWIGECLEHAWVARIHDFAALRPIVLLVVVTTVVLLGAVLSRVMGSFAAGVIVAGAAIFSPGYAFMYFQGLTAGPVLIGFLFAVLSFDLLMRADGEFGKKGWRWVSSRITLSFIFFLLACFTYPTFAFIFVPLALLYFGFDQSLDFEQRLRRCFRTGVFVLVGTLIYFGLSKAFIFLFLLTKEAGPDLGQYSFSIASNASLVLKKLKALTDFFYHSLTVANFLNWPGYLKIALVLAPALLVAKRVGPERGSRYRRYKEVCLYAVAVPVVMIAGVTPWLLSNFEAATHRHTVTLQFLIVFSIGVLASTLAKSFFDKTGARGIRELILLMVLLVPTAFQQVKLSVMEVVQSDAEIRYMRAAFQQLIASDEFVRLEQFHVIRPDPALSYIGWPRTGKAEMNQPATSANPEHIFQMVTALLREFLPNEKLRMIKIVDCRLDAICIQESAKPGVLVLSQSAWNQEPELLNRSFVLDYRLIQSRPSK